MALAPLFGFAAPTVSPHDRDGILPHRVSSTLSAASELKRRGQVGEGHSAFVRYKRPAPVASPAQPYLASGGAGGHPPHLHDKPPSPAPHTSSTLGDAGPSSARGRPGKKPKNFDLNLPPTPDSRHEEPESQRPAQPESSSASLQRLARGSLIPRVRAGPMRGPAREFSVRDREAHKNRTKDGIRRYWEARRAHETGESAGPSSSDPAQGSSPSPPKQ